MSNGKLVSIVLLSTFEMMFPTQSYLVRGYLTYRGGCLWLCVLTVHLRRFPVVCSLTSCPLYNFSPFHRETRCSTENRIWRGKSCKPQSAHSANPPPQTQSVVRANGVPTVGRRFGSEFSDWRWAERGGASQEIADRERHGFEAGEYVDYLQILKIC